MRYNYKDWDARKVEGVMVEEGSMGTIETNVGRGTGRNTQERRTWNWQERPLKNTIEEEPLPMY